MDETNSTGHGELPAGSDGSLYLIELGGDGDHKQYAVCETLMTFTSGTDLKEFSPSAIAAYFSRQKPFRAIKLPELLAKLAGQTGQSLMGQTGQALRGQTGSPSAPAVGITINNQPNVSGRPRGD